MAQQPDPWTLIPGADLITATVSIIEGAELDGDPQKVARLSCVPFSPSSRPPD